MPRATFLDLPAELRTYIYDLSGCLTVWQCCTCRQQWHGDGPVLSASKCEDYYTLSESHSPQDAYSTTPPNEANASPSSSTHGPAGFWVNRSSHLIEPVAESETSTATAGTAKSLRATKRCGKYCTASAHGAHVQSVAQPALTRVCKRIRAETLSIFYGIHTFFFTIFDNQIDGGALEKWLATIGPANASSLRCLHVVYRQKQQSRYLENTLLPLARTLGVRVDEAVISCRLSYPFCYCEMCVLETVRTCD
ncbi:hypothetical protein LTR36_001748 [Oleoguttula mirabilis]|uniref:Uncharacterized protein n=1 Tax=Oleoguttula mirabilis TaxID=1507867 RepID=A0AAV9JMH1_9PEZI|nr:hypothetical protein LTR36_001748 [Oleoguttula mirabilis]